MNTALAETIMYVTGKPGIENTTQQELQNLVTSYPYFAPAQLAYAAKLKSDNSFKLQTQMQKAGLFFNNQRWLQYQLMEVNVGSFKTLTETAAPAETVSTEKTSFPAHPTFIPGITIPTVEDVKGIMNGINDVKEAATQTMTPLPAIETTIAEPVEIEITQTEDYSIPEPIPEPVMQKTVAAVEEVVEPIVSSPANDIHAEIAAMKANWSHRPGFEEFQEHPLAEKIADTEIIVPAHSLESLKNDWNKPVENPASAPLPFETEPYYTIDYFASQGIKFDYSKEPQDKLTTKMMKFTDWLKKMKGGKTGEMQTETDPELEKVIINIATNSNESKEVVTETMAEIFAKQGKLDKAVQLYIKLSFLIPDKSAYFAAKIKELKGI